MNIKRILITGVTGTVGYEILKQLKDSLHEITIFDLDTKQNRQKLKPFTENMRIVFGDIADKKQIGSACKNQDLVIHLAAIIPPLADEKPGLAHRVNVEGTKNLLLGLKRHSPKAFLLFASSISVYGDRLNTPGILVGDPLQPSDGDYYAQTKIETEELIKETLSHWSIFRLSAIMGVKNHKISPLMFHQPLATKMEICTPADTARAFVHAIENLKALNTKTFNLGGGENCRIEYRHFLSRAFELYGLGKVNFPKNAFARRNFHCGYYMDGDELETILHFRQDTLESYFSKIKKAIPVIQRFLTRMVSPLIKYHLTRLSDPLKAIHTSDLPLIFRYFGVMLPSEL